MTIAFWCVLVAAMIPYLFVSYAKMTPAYLKGHHNKDPRKYLETVDAPRQRAARAQLNGYEAFPPFAAGVLIATHLGATHDTVDLLALVFVGARLAHGILYVLDWDRLRSVAWAIGFGCVLSLFFVAASA